MAEVIKSRCFQGLEQQLARGICLFFYRALAASDFNVTMPSPQLGVGGGPKEGDTINISINVSKSAFEI